MSGLGGWSWVGALAGAAFGVGLVFVGWGLASARRPTLESRLAPYLRDLLPPSTLLAGPRSSSWQGAVLGPAIRDIGRWVDRILGGSTSVRQRLQRAGLPPDVEAFRGEQVIWAALGGAAGSALAVVAILTRGAAVLPVVVLVLVSALSGLLARDQWLSRQARAREETMLAEFPTVAELLALAVSAGEGAAGALDRVCRMSRGELSLELGRCLADARAGANLPTALQGLADRTGLVSLTRFVDGMVVAVERGTPLAEVLRAQAQDVREAGRRAVMEAGGRKEIAMMVPVVFMVLPVTVLFAIFPGVTFLRLST